MDFERHRSSFSGVQVNYCQGYFSTPSTVAYPTLCTPGTIANETPARWYVASTFPRHEKVIADRLKSKDVETYLPLYWAVRSWGQRRVKLELPLFPGYVFVRTELTRKARILEQPGIIRFVGFNGRPSPLSDEEMERLRTSLNSCKAEPYPYLSAGRRVRIKSGPLSGVEGTIVRRKGAIRLVVQIDLICRAVLLELDAIDAQLTA
jgi:transcription antitermination factor NusG